MTDNNSRCGMLWFSDGASVLHARLLYFFCPILFLAFFPISRSFAQKEQSTTDPKLLSIFPLGARQGATVQAEILGNLLPGSYAVWSDMSGLIGKILAVEKVEGEEKDAFYNLGKRLKKPLELYRARIELEIQPTAPAGMHSLRLIGPRGISDVVPFRVVKGMVLQEASSSHQSIKDAIPFEVPTVINGRLEKPGELDYYSFLAKQGQEITFDVILAQNCAPQLALFRAGGSWFDPERLSRLTALEQKSSDLMSVPAHATYQFSREGIYFLEVSSLFGKGSTGSTYQVRVAAGLQARQYEAKSEPPSGEWPERNFSRELDGNWMSSLEARSVEGSVEPTRGASNAAIQSFTGNVGPEQPSTTPPNLVARFSRIAELEPNDQVTQAQNIPIPSIIEGAIGRGGDIDNFKFKVEAGQKLAFDIETPDAKPPYFNPRIGVIDGHDRELLSNVERRLSIYNNNSDPQVYLKGMEPKVVYGFEHGGEYVLQVRDITSRYGNSTYRYRILIRPQIPHVGDVSLMEGDRINLVRGQPKKLTIMASYEEGYRGEVSFAFSGLPQGVQSFTAVQFDDGKAPIEVTENPDVISPKLEKTTVVLLAGPEAPLTSKPATVQLHGWPIVAGKMGSNLMIREIPLMVVDDAKEKKEDKPPSGQ